MAACGINEHKEALRKQRVIDRKAAARKMRMEEMYTDNVMMPQTIPEDPEAPGYMRKCGSPPGITGNTNGCGTGYIPQYKPGLGDLAGNHSSTAIDRLRREGVRAQQLVTYSAKLPDRLTSINYTQQW